VTVQNPVVVCHTLTLPSSPPVTTAVPFGEYASAQTS
jgi:hypothetical protein